jgi:hypothetical protein
MDNSEKKDRCFKCDICKKDYSSYKSWWNHNKKFHDESNNKIIKCNTKVIKCNTISNTNNNVKEGNKKYSCRFCKKSFEMRQYRWKHEKICKQKEENNPSMQQQINELKEQFALILKEKGKVHPKTLQKINKQMNNITNNTTNTNNGSIVNNTYIAFPNLSYSKIFKGSEIKSILNKQYMSLEESIKQVHFNDKLPEYSNLFITNMKDDLAYVFNGKEFIAVKKHEMLNELIDIHSNEINISLEKYRNKLNEEVITRLEKFLEKLNDQYTKMFDGNTDKTYPNYKAYKIDHIKLMIYNESDKKKLELLKSMELEEKSFDDSDSDNEIII